MKLRRGARAAPPALDMPPQPGASAKRGPPPLPPSHGGPSQDRPPKGAPAGGAPRSPAEALQPARPPRPPRKHRPRRKRRRLGPFFRLVNGVLTIALIVMLGVGIVAVLAAKRFEAAGPLTRASLVAIPRGRGLNAIATGLERDGVISDRRLFVANVYYRGAQSQLKAGEYQFPKGASMNDVIERLVKGRAILHKVTLPEGRTSQQIVARLNATQILKGEIAQVPAEGSLLPDTHKFSRGMTRTEIIERMQADQAKYLEAIWQTRQDGLPFATKAEALILASIVEKETGRPDERANVAAVFVNRLRRGMKLQSDPTIIYGLVGGRGSLGHPIRRSELNKKTAYNTYQIDGLPPTPICNPGRAAIEAVLNPAISDDLYFVADGTGGHAFAKTLKAHNANVARWRRLEKTIRARRKARRSQTTAVAATTIVPLSGVPNAGPGAPAAPAAAARVSAPKPVPRPALTIINRVEAAAVATSIDIPLPVRKPKRRRR